MANTKGKVDFAARAVRKQRKQMVMKFKIAELQMKQIKGVSLHADLDEATRREMASTCRSVGETMNFIAKWLTGSNKAREPEGAVDHV